MVKDIPTIGGICLKYIALKSKIHSAKVTKRDYKYEGSIEIDQDLLDAANLKAYEKVLVANFTNGYRYETYVIPGERNSGIICVSGGGARYSCIGDTVTIFSFGVYNKNEVPHPIVVLVDEHNKIRERLRK